MMLARLLLIAVLGAIAACGDSKDLICDEGPYQVAVRAPRVQSPEGLDSLDPLNEVPLPAASPRAPRPVEGPCLENPPETIRIE
jgi:hypothetical protein